MKRIIATTALALAMSTAAFADDHLKPINSYQMEQQGDIYASDLIGMRVYATETEDYDGWNAETRVEEGAEREWDDIGEVNDVILGRDGSIKAVILGIGGFLGIGEKDVAVAMSDIKMVQEQDDDDDFFLVVKTNKQMLTDAEPYQRTTAAEMQEETAEAEAEVKEETAEAEAEVKEETAEAEAEIKEETAEAETETEGAMLRDEDGRPMLRQPAVPVREGYREAEMEELTSETLTGARVYGSNDEDVGEVDELILNDDGSIKRVVLDVGGFLGLGEHEVAVSMNELRIVRDEDGDDVRVYIDATQEELEAQPEYND